MIYFGHYSPAVLWILVLLIINVSANLAETNKWKKILTIWFFVWLAFGIFILMDGAYRISSEKEGDAKGPCVSHERQIHYHPIKNAMMPARVCVNRGEWVEEEPDQ